MDNKKFFIIGSNGQLAREFIRVFTQRKINFAAPAENIVSLTDAPGLQQAIMAERPDYVLNCAAYNNVEEAERNPQVAFAVNAEAVKSLAEFCHNQKIFLIHFGTDYVFDGEKKNFYTEEDVPNPLNQYGQSKLQGELHVQKIMTDYLIFRLSWVIGHGTQNFLYKLNTWAAQKPVLQVSADEVSVPTFVEDVVEGVLAAVSKKLSGLYHLTNSGYASRYELAKKYIEVRKLNNLVIPVPMDTFPSNVRRAKFTAMSNAKLSKEAGIIIPTWGTALMRYINQSGS